MTPFQSAEQLARRVRDQERTISRLRRDNRELQRKLEDITDAAGMIPAEYAEALVSLHHIAHHGTPSEGAGVHGQPGSRSPTHHPGAYRAYRREQADLLKRARTIQSQLEVICG